MKALSDEIRSIEIKNKQAYTGNRSSKEDEKYERTSRTAERKINRILSGTSS
ncbi:hypothetical protein GCM10008910_32170 [Faecalicatena orotica]|jgi:hypothetical protein